MANKTGVVSVPRELLETVEHFLATGDRQNSITLGRLRALLAAPAEDVRAVVEEPVGRVSYIGNGFVRVRITGDNPKLEELLYSRPQRRVVSQCSEVTQQCSGHLRTQAKLFPNSTVCPPPPRHTGFLLPDREEPDYALEKMQAYVLDCIKAFVQQSQ